MRSVRRWSCLVLSVAAVSSCGLSSARVISVESTGPIPTVDPAAPFVTMPGTNVQLRVPADFAIDGPGQAIYCANQPVCSGTSMVIIWSTLNTDTVPQASIDSDVADLKSSGFLPEPIELGGLPAWRTDMTSRTPFGEELPAVAFSLATATRFVAIRVSGSDAHRTAFDSLVAAVAGARFADAIAPVDRGWEFGAAAGLSVVRGGSRYAVYGPHERPVRGDVRILVTNGCYPQKVDLAADSWRRQQARDYLSQVLNGTVSDDKPIRVDGERAWLARGIDDSDTNNIWRYWVVVVFRKDHPITIYSSHNDSRGVEPIDVYERALANFHFTAGIDQPFVCNRPPAALSNTTSTTHG